MLCFQADDESSEADDTALNFLPDPDKVYENEEPDEDLEVPHGSDSSTKSPKKWTHFVRYAQINVLKFFKVNC